MPYVRRLPTTIAKSLRSLAEDPQSYRLYGGQVIFHVTRYSHSSRPSLRNKTNYTIDEISNQRIFDRMWNTELYIRRHELIRYAWKYGHIFVGDPLRGSVEAITAVKYNHVDTLVSYLRQVDQHVLRGTMAYLGANSHVDLLNTLRHRLGLSELFFCSPNSGVAQNVNYLNE